MWRSRKQEQTLDPHWGRPHVDETTLPIGADVLYLHVLLWDWDRLRVGQYDYLGESAALAHARAGFKLAAERRGAERRPQERWCPGRA